MDALLLKNLIEKIACYDDPIAYKELFLLYHKKLVSFSMTITHSKESAEEVVSDVFLKLWKNRSSLPTIENFHLYIYIVAKNLSINRILKEKRQQVFSLDETVVEISNLYPNADEKMVTAEMQRRLKLAIEQLPARCRLIFRLAKEDGLKYREVAELLQLSVKTVENQMTIALKKIADSIQFDLSKSTFN